MSFDWGEYIRLADELRQTPATDGLQTAKLRSAISRAYYGAFKLTAGRLEAAGHAVPGGPEAHRYVQDRLKASTEREARQLGEDLKRLRTARNRADYDADYGSPIEPAAVILVQLAHKVQTRLATLTVPQP